MKRKLIITLTLLLILFSSSQPQLMVQEAGANKEENHNDVSNELDRKVLDIKKFLKSAKNKAPSKRISNEKLRELKVKSLNKLKRQGELNYNISKATNLSKIPTISRIKSIQLKNSLNLLPNNRSRATTIASIIKSRGGTSISFLKNIPSRKELFSGSSKLPTFQSVKKTTPSHEIDTFIRRRSDLVYRLKKLKEAQEKIYLEAGDIFKPLVWHWAPGTPGTRFTDCKASLGNCSYRYDAGSITNNYELENKCDKITFFCEKFRNLLSDFDAKIEELEDFPKYQLDLLEEKIKAAEDMAEKILGYISLVRTLSEEIKELANRYNKAKGIINLISDLASKKGLAILLDETQRKNLYLSLSRKCYEQSNEFSGVRCEKLATFIPADKLATLQADKKENKRKFDIIKELLTGNKQLTRAIIRDFTTLMSSTVDNTIFSKILSDLYRNINLVITIGFSDNLKIDPESILNSENQKNCFFQKELRNDPFWQKYITFVNNDTVSLQSEFTYFAQTQVMNEIIKNAKSCEADLLPQKIEKLFKQITLEVSVRDVVGSAGSLGTETQVGEEINPSKGTGQLQGLANKTVSADNSIIKKGENVKIASIINPGKAVYNDFSFVIVSPAETGDCTVTEEINPDRGSGKVKCRSGTCYSECQAGYSNTIQKGEKAKIEKAFSVYANKQDNYIFVVKPSVKNITLHSDVFQIIKEGDRILKGLDGIQNDLDDVASKIINYFQARDAILAEVDKIASEILDLKGNFGLQEIKKILQSSFERLKPRLIELLGNPLLKLPNLEKCANYLLLNIQSQGSQVKKENIIGFLEMQGNCYLNENNRDILPPLSVSNSLQPIFDKLALTGTSNLSRCIYDKVQEYKTQKIIPTRETLFQLFNECGIGADNLLKLKLQEKKGNYFYVCLNNLTDILQSYLQWFYSCKDNTDLLWSRLTNLMKEKLILYQKLFNLFIDIFISENLNIFSSVENINFSKLLSSDFFMKENYKNYSCLLCLFKYAAQSMDDLYSTMLNYPRELREELLRKLCLNNIPEPVVKKLVKIGFETEDIEDRAKRTLDKAGLRKACLGAELFSNKKINTNNRINQDNIEGITKTIETIIRVAYSISNCPKPTYKK